MRYYELSGTPESKTIHADEDWLAAYRPNLFPEGCKHMTRQSTFERVTVISIPSSALLGWISPLEMYLAEQDTLLEMLGAGGMKAVKIAPVNESHGSEIRKYCAFMPRDSILVRGQLSSTLKGACEKCGHLFYWPQPAREPEHWYLVRAGLRDESPIYAGGVGSLILREDIYERTRRLSLRNFRLRELPILDVPLDGLPADLPPAISPKRQQELGDLLTRDVTDYDRQWIKRMANAGDVEKGRTVEWIPPKSH